MVRIRNGVLCLRSMLLSTLSAPYSAVPGSCSFEPQRGEAHRGGEDTQDVLAPDPPGNLETFLGPCRKRERGTRNTRIMTPVEDAADVTPTLTIKMVCPNRRGASKRVCMRIVSTVDHLPLQVPSAIRRLPKPEINVSALFSHPQPRLSRSVPNDRDAIADDTSAKRTAMSVPVFAC